jgi:predicted transcriptional regulator YdeE
MTNAIKVIEFGPVTLVGLEADFYGGMSPKFNGKEILGPMWGQIFTKFSELGLPINHMVAATGRAKSGEEGLLNQFAGCVVDSVPDDLNGLSVLQLPKVKLAVTEHIGSMDTFMETIGNFYRNLLPASGLKELFPERFEYEIYDERFSQKDPNSVMRIGCVVA